jgi:hypothetical protein
MSLRSVIRKKLWIGTLARAWGVNEDALRYVMSHGRACHWHFEWTPVHPSNCMGAACPGCPGYFTPGPAVVARTIARYDKRIARENRRLAKRCALRKERNTRRTEARDPARPSTWIPARQWS